MRGLKKGEIGLILALSASACQALSPTALQPHSPTAFQKLGPAGSQSLRPSAPQLVKSQLAQALRGGGWESTWMQIGRVGVHGLGALCMGHSLFLELYRNPKPDAEWSVGVDRIFGKFIYLTVQSVTILLAYFSLSFVSEVFRLANRPHKQLEELAYWLSPVAGGYGWFVTIMFYVLCWANKDFQVLVVQYWEAKGLPFGRWQHYIHFPSVWLVIADGLTKRADLAAEAITSVTSYIPLYVVYSCWYTFCLRLNYFYTARWPYPFLAAFTKEWQHWGFYGFAFLMFWGYGSLQRALILTSARMRLGWGAMLDAAGAQDMH